MSIRPNEAADRTIERIARESYGRLLAYLFSHIDDLASAEDSLGDALLAALATWPLHGVPQRPEAWLLTTARNRLIDNVRHQEVACASELTLRLISEYANQYQSSEFPDERLKLLFVCAHPAIEASIHTPLMLQTVLGLDAARIAQSFLTSPAAMSQRLVRAKAKIRFLGIRFEGPHPCELLERRNAVLDAIYAAFGIGGDDIVGSDQRGRDLAEEAIWLARIFLKLMPREDEARGLLALMLHCEARRAARRGPTGQYVPLSQQDPFLWSFPLIEEAERHLGDASRQGRAGRFQIEAAIQSVHAERARSGCTVWPALVVFYEQLQRICPTVGTVTGYAAALAEVKGAEAGLAALATIPLDKIRSYQPYWAVRAHLLQRLGKLEEASQAFNRAIGLAEDPAIRQFLLQKRGCDFFHRDVEIRPPQTSPY
jgi:predicted RNA polymerase sigma factor